MISVSVDEPRRSINSGGHTKDQYGSNKARRRSALRDESDFAKISVDVGAVTFGLTHQLRLVVQRVARESFKIVINLKAARFCQLQLPH
jgi:hypothetical protein